MLSSSACLELPRKDLQTLRDLRDVALPKYKGRIIEVIRCKSKIYYWREGKRCSATIFETAAEAARDFLGKWGAHHLHAMRQHATSSRGSSGRRANRAGVAT